MRSPLDSALYSPNPPNADRFLAERNVPPGIVQGSGVPRTFSLEKDDARRDMFTQQAFFINPPQMRPARTVAPFDVGERTGFPQWFSLGVRAAAGKADPSGKPEAMRLAVMSPQRFNRVLQEKRGINDVRDGLYTDRPSRSRTGILNLRT